MRRQRFGNSLLSVLAAAWLAGARARARAGGARPRAGRDRAAGGDDRRAGEARGAGPASSRGVAETSEPADAAEPAPSPAVPPSATAEPSPAAAEKATRAASRRFRSRRSPSSRSGAASQPIPAEPDGIRDAARPAQGRAGLGREHRSPAADARGALRAGPARRGPRDRRPRRRRARRRSPGRRPRTRSSRVLPAVAGGFMLLLLVSLLRGWGDAVIAIEYPGELRGTFACTSPAPSRPRAGFRAPAARARRCAPSAGPAPPAATTTTWCRARPSSGGSGPGAGGSRSTAISQSPSGAEVIATHFEDGELRVRRGSSGRIDFDFRPKDCPVDVKVVWDRKPVPDALVAVQGAPYSLRYTRGGVVRVGVEPRPPHARGGQAATAWPSRRSRSRPSRPPTSSSTSARASTWSSSAARPPSSPTCTATCRPPRARSSATDTTTWRSGCCARVAPRARAARGGRRALRGRRPAARSRRAARGALAVEAGRAALRDRAASSSARPRCSRRPASTSAPGDSFQRAGRHDEAADSYREAGDVPQLGRIAREVRAALRGGAGRDRARRLGPRDPQPPAGDAAATPTTSRPPSCSSRPISAQGHLDLATRKVRR